MAGLVWLVGWWACSLNGLFLFNHLLVRWVLACLHGWLVKFRARVAPTMVPKWYQNGTNMTPNWSHHGPKMVPKSLKIHTKSIFINFGSKKILKMGNCREFDSEQLYNL